jgi:hypothetical protein
MVANNKIADVRLHSYPKIRSWQRRVYTCAEAANVLAVSLSTVRSWLHRKQELFSEPRYRRSGRHPRRLRVLTYEDMALLIGLVLQQRPRISARTKRKSRSRDARV